MAYFCSKFTIDTKITENLSEVIINLDRVDPIEFFGSNNSRLNRLKKAFPKLKLVARGTKIKVNGSDEEIDLFQEKLNQMISMLEKYGQLDDRQVDGMLEDAENGESDMSNTEPEDVLVFGRNGLRVKAKSVNQELMVDLSTKNDIVFAIGPAGTGKTYTAVALAVKALKSKAVKRIVLTRPAVEAGESLGFLPGDLKEKIDPYLRPLYDALDDMFPIEKLNYYMENRIIEVAPLAFMRGRTLDHSFIILDEAQNATNPQMKMFLTRIGPSAKCIVTGDLTQTDLPRNMKSGLPTAINLLKDISGIGMVYMDEKDVIRHKLVKQIVKAYNRLAEDEEKLKIKKTKDDNNKK